MGFTYFYSLNEKDIQIIGSGFSSLSAACYLAQAGHKRIYIRKNSSVGGRARQLKKKGLLLILAHHGIGCQMFLIGFFQTLEKKHPITTKLTN